MRIPTLPYSPYIHSLNTYESDAAALLWVSHHRVRCPRTRTRQLSRIPSCGQCDRTRELKHRLDGQASDSLAGFDRDIKGNVNVGCVPDIPRHHGSDFQFRGAQQRRFHEILLSTLVGQIIAGTYRACINIEAGFAGFSNHDF